MLEKEDAEGELEKEVKRIIAAANEEEKLKEAKTAQEIKSYKRDYIAYSIFGCGEAYISTAFLFASITPIKFENTFYSAITVGGTVVNAVIAYLCFRHAKSKLELYCQKTQSIDKIYKGE